MRQTYDGKIPQLLKALIMWSIPLASLSSEMIEQRGKDIVDSVTNGSGSFISVSRVHDRPGLSNATLIRYADSRGEDQSLVMLPDGEHIINGGLLRVPLIAKQAHSVRNDQRAVIAEDAAVELAGALGVHNDDVASALRNAAKEYDAKDRALTIHDFRIDAAEAFEIIFNGIRPDQLVDAYTRLLRRTNQIQDGSGAATVYVFYDPSCGFCVREHKELTPHAEASSFKLSYIPVSTASRAPFTHLLSLLDSDLNNTTRINRLKQLAVENVPAQSITLNNKEAANKRLVFNNSVMSLIRSQQSAEHPSGTPLIILEKENGELSLFHGSNNVENIIAELQ